MNPWLLSFLISILAGWVNRGQQDLLESLQEENRVLREPRGARRLRFTDVQRRCLAAKPEKMGRKGLFEIRTRVTPDPLPRGYWRLIAQEYDVTDAEDGFLNELAPSSTIAIHGSPMRSGSFSSSPVGRPGSSRRAAPT